MEPAKQTALLFERNRVTDMETLQAASKQRSRRSLFRDLVRLGYFSSYTHSGRYYTLAGIPEFDENGLWYYRGIGFSRFGTLKETLVRRIDDTAVGCTHAELKAVLHLRVHDTLRVLVRAAQIRRETLGRTYLYLSVDPARGAEQLLLRHEQVAQAAQVPPLPPRETVLLVLVEALHASEGLAPASVVADRLVARGAGVTPEQVVHIYAHFGLDLEKKTAGPA